jgi:hypothetical protein
MYGMLGQTLIDFDDDAALLIFADTLFGPTVRQDDEVFVGVKRYRSRWDGT